MSLEIERKFILANPPPWLEDHPALEIEQGYLGVSEETEVRLQGPPAHGQAGQR